MRSPLNMLRVYKKRENLFFYLFPFQSYHCFSHFFLKKKTIWLFWWARKLAVITLGKSWRAVILINHEFFGLKWNVRYLNCWDELFTSFTNIIKTLIFEIPDDEIRNFLIFHNNLLMGCIYWNELWDLWSNFDRICSIMWENWWKVAKNSIIE